MEVTYQEIQVIMVLFLHHKVITIIYQSIWLFYHVRRILTIFVFLDYRNDYPNSRRPSSNWHANQNQFPQNDQNTNHGNYGRQQNNSYRSDNNAYPNYGTQYTSDQPSMRRNDRPGYFTAGFQANNSQ